MVNLHDQSTIFDAEKGTTLNQFEESLEKLQSNLAKFGLTANQSKVYIFLGKYGSKTAPEVNKALKLPRTETYKILSSLQNKGIVSASFQHPIKFSALPLTNAIKSMLNEEKNRINKLENQKEELVKLWKSISVENKETESKEDKFQVLQNENQINSKIKDMISTPGQVLILGSEKDFANLYHADLLDMINTNSCKLLTSAEKISHIFYGIKSENIRKSSINEKLCFVVNDDEILFYIKNHQSKVTSAIWTNSDSMIYSKKLLFEMLWIKSGDKQ